MLKLTLKKDPACVSKYNSECEKKTLMISNDIGWHYISATRLFALLRAVPSK